jgi:hypothetical protein
MPSDRASRCRMTARNSSGVGCEVTARSIGTQPGTVLAATACPLAELVRDGSDGAALAEVVGRRDQQAARRGGEQDDEEDVSPAGTAEDPFDRRDGAP